ncbi:MAG: putative DNA-binding domain-containing protein [Acidobacteria bacterium]|nr:putative DNA-binding domain-containing protein [Acidobacteriota bacterium]
MPSLADTQSHLRRAVVTGDATGVVPLLIGGRDAEKRLAIHRRHYETSLVTALLDKFPATVWLAGSPFVTEAARHFVHQHPPHAPCIAEYGAEFPEFVSTRPAADLVPYLRAFAELEWCLGQVAVAIDRPPVPLERLSQIDVDVLMNAECTLQPGLHYLHVSWPVDDVMKLYLTDTAPDRFVLAPAEAWMEIQGARGEFRINRLDPGEFIFRQAVQEGRAIGDAAECALDASAGFDPGGALARLVSERLVTGIVQGGYGDAA